MRIRIHEKFDWRVPGKRVMITYPIGDHTMRREAGEEAIRQGKGREIDAAKKADNPGAGVAAKTAKRASKSKG